MFSKNLKYYRLKAGLSKAKLAQAAGVTPAAISNYELDRRRPQMSVLKKIAQALGVTVSDFLAYRNDELSFSHGEFRKNSSLSQEKQKFVKESVEEYFSRFFCAVRCFDEDVLPPALSAHCLPLTENHEENARALRSYLGLPQMGPVGNLVALLENAGVLVLYLDAAFGDFSGMNGNVNGRPYIVVNRNMTMERIRATLVHELAHFAFIWSEKLTDKEVEVACNAISGCFLLPEADLRRELGTRRSAITRDMEIVCREYGVSMMLMVYRSGDCGITSDSVQKNFYIAASRAGWRKNEPTRILFEDVTLFKQLVFRAVAEEKISVQKGAELLKMPFEEVWANSSSAEVH